VTILRVGPNKQYSDGWETAFSAKKGGAKSTAKKPVPSKKAAPKKSVKKGKK
jgi:hypothetical protein